MISRLAHLYELLVRAASNCQSVFLLAIRLYWGWQFCQTGWGKLHNLPNVTEFFAGLGIPFPGFNAVLAGSTECFGGALLLLGLGSRLVALPLIFTMIVAYATDGKEAVQAIFSDPDKFVTWGDGRINDRIDEDASLVQTFTELEGEGHVAAIDG